VLAQANASRFGLQVGIFANDVRTVWRAFEHLNAGAVIHNDVPTTRYDQMPYGGVMDSGVGREGPRYAIEEYTEPKLLVLNPQT
jgi:acyl-CoA reductase-like NAD-dependent aldehyde dehydrogenase